MSCRHASPSRRHQLLRSCSPLLLALALGACGGSQQAVPVDQGVRPVRLFPVRQSADFRRLQFVGRVDAAQTVDLSFEVVGRLAELPLREGQRISRGELVAALDPVDYQLRLQEANVQLKLAQKDYDRKSSLLAERAMAESAVDDARSILELRQVSLKQAEQALGYTRIRAPFDAYVARRFTDNHVRVDRGDPIVRLLDLSELWVRVSVPEALLATADAERVRSIVAYFDFAPDVDFPLTLRENTGEADAVAQTYEVAFAMASPPEWNILPGMTATVEVRVTAEGAVVIPGSALVSGPDGGFQVWVYEPEGGTVVRRQVDAGTPVETGVPVSAGLTGGELIVATGASFLQDGMTVRPLNQRELGTILP